MLFNSLHFAVFFPVVVLLYFVLPFRARWVWLLASSFYFYMAWNPSYIILIVSSILITYLTGLLICRLNNDPRSTVVLRKKKWLVAFSFVSNLAILFFFKYYGFFIENVDAVLATAGFDWRTPGLNVLLPVGITFYTFQALSYTMDLYRGQVKAERHLGRYALYVSFFPQLVAGPIERSTHLLGQFTRRNRIDYHRMK